MYIQDDLLQNKFKILSKGLKHLILPALVLH